MSEYIKYTVENDEGEEVEHKCPAKYEVCHRCQGKGTHVNPAVDGHGISPEEFAEDPSFEENYFGGVYDITCQECNGERVELVPDENSTDKAALKHYEEWATEKYQAERERAHEIEMVY